MADIFHFLFFSFFIIFGCTTITTSEAAQTVPAMYVFGDSLIDVGNNNEFITLARANFPPYGIDFFNGEPTGRFSNGQNSADFLAEKLGLPTPPPYLSLVSESSDGSIFLAGVNFASGGSGILNSTNALLVKSLEEQFGYYTRVHESTVQLLGPDGAQNHLSKSIFTIVVGSNDMFVHFSQLSNPNTTQQYVDSMISNFKGLLVRLYKLGARKLMITGITAIGCIPGLRIKNNNECQEDINKWSAIYNEGLKSMLTQLELKDMHYSYFDTYILFQEFILHPATYGFSNVREACCGSGRLPCWMFSTYCENRSEYLFWDQYHPTEKAVGIFVDYIFNGSQNYATPINLEQLLAVQPKNLAPQSHISNKNHAQCLSYS